MLNLNSASNLSENYILLTNHSISNFPVKKNLLEDLTTLRQNCRRFEFKKK